MVQNAMEQQHHRLQWKFACHSASSADSAEHRQLGQLGQKQKQQDRPSPQN